MIVYICKGLSLRHRLMLRHFIRRECAGMDVLPDAPVEIEVVENIRKKQYSSLWYGGTAAYIRYKGWTFEVSACGDVFAELTMRGYPDDALLYVKDKNNAGSLGEALRPYLATDKALNAALCHKHPHYRLFMDSNNWWECFVTDPQGGFHDLMWSLDSDHILAGMAEVIFWMDKVIREIDTIDRPALAVG